MFDARSILVLAVLSLTALAVVEPLRPVRAHPGGLNAQGCHTCRTSCPEFGLEPGEYHCHGGEGAPAAGPAGAAAGASPPEDAGSPQASVSATPSSIAPAPPLQRPLVGPAAGSGDDGLIEGLRVTAFVAWGVFAVMLAGAAARWMARRRSL